MTTSLYTLGRWTGSQSNDVADLYGAFPLYASAAHPHTLAHALDCFVIDSTDRNRKAILSFGNRFDGAHKKENWKGADGMVLECASEDREELEYQLARRELAYHGISGVGIGTKRDTWAALLPFDQVITNDHQLLMVSSRVAKDMGVHSMSRGFAQLTFQICAAPGAECTFVEGNPIDVEDYLARTGKEGWAVAADYELKVVA